MYNINEVIIQHMNYVVFYNWINTLFSEDNKVPKTLCEARKVGGSAKYKQSKTVCDCFVL